jgi:hypothetical protein
MDSSMDIIVVIYRYPEMPGTFLNYISENAKSILKELNAIKIINGAIVVIYPALVIILFLIGAYITSKTPSRAVLPEGFTNLESDAVKNTITTNTGGSDGVEGSPTSNNEFASINNNRCPNILIQHGNEIFLYNSKVEKVPGVNPIRFSNLDDYSEFMEWLQGRGIRCPVLFLQFSYDSQGNAVYKMRPSPTDLQGGLSPNVPYSPAPAALVELMDASRDNPPFNNQMYDGYDPLNFNIGDYTSQDAVFRAKELTMQYSDNPMDSNWGGIRYSESVVDSGAYVDRTRPDTPALSPMKIPVANDKYRSARYTGDAISRGRGKDVEIGKMRRPA